MLRPRCDFPKGRTAQALAGDLRRLGLPTGAAVLVHASLRAVGPVAGGAETLLEALQMVIGESAGGADRLVRGTRLEHRAREPRCLR